MATLLGTILSGATKINGFRERQYLKPGMVQLYGKIGSSRCDCITVTCYDKIIYSICPNPRDSDRCKNIEDQYMKGVYANKVLYTLTKEQFNNQTFWIP